jgi:hypothetical protein
MLELTCTTLGTAYATHGCDLLSTHRTATGATGYARCVCGGTVVVSHDGHRWHQMGHASGPRTPTAAVRGAALVTERCA